MKGALILTLFFNSFFVIGQERPSWINPNIRSQSYPESTHFVGFSSQYFDKESDFNLLTEKVKSLARATLAETIYISIRSTSLNTMANVNGFANESYGKAVLTTASLETSGLKTDVFIDNKKRIVYGLAYLSKETLLNNYKGLVSNAMIEVEDSYRRLDESNSRGNYSDYLSVLEKLEDLKSIQKMLLSLGISAEIDLKLEKWRELHQLVNERIQEIRNAEDLDLNEAAYFLVDQLIVELGVISNEIAIGLITYKNKNIGTEFSERFRLSMLDALTDRKISISTKQNEVTFLLSGSYWPSNSDIKVSALIEQYSDNEITRIVSTGSVFITKNVLEEEGISIDPPDLEVAIKRVDEIQAGELADHGMHADLWTNKVGTAQIFKEGEILKLSVRVNRPAYVRLLNIWSDGSKLLLLDNFYIDESKTNQVITLPFEWETACPCGVEYLQLYAQSAQFSNLRIHEEDGFVIVDESLDSMLKKSRGFGNRKEIEDYYSEQSLTVTTLKK